MSGCKTESWLPAGFNLPIWESKSGSYFEKLFSTVNREIVLSMASPSHHIVQASEKQVSKNICS
jgi:hypothetical protein